ncbi:MAG: hypothetical protein IKR07_00770 [Oscillospiraceae bacterium]|nr:hypothetical protein [Oscillospiraceae bacterium]
MTVNVYEQYFAADGVFSGVRRRGALVMLTADSDAGNIRYEAAVSFFPHVDEEDFAVSYDAYFSRVLYEAHGRRSKKREAALMDQLRGTVDMLAGDAGCAVLWDVPLLEPRRG